MNKAERLDAINEVKEDSKVLEFIAITMQERDTALKEINRLNNIISEFEKWLIEYRTFIDIPDYYEEGIIDCIDDTLNKLKELKEKE